MSSLKYKKIYIDTRYKTPDSVSTSHFKVNLPETLSFEGNTCFYIDDFTCGHSWTSIEDFNNKLYLYISQNDNPDNKYAFVIAIANGNYTGADFAIELQNKIRTTTALIQPNMFNVFYNTKNNSLTISITFSGYKFRVLTPDDLKTALTGKFYATYNKSRTNDINEVLSNLEGSDIQYDYNTPFVSGFLNFQPINNIYLHSNSLGNFNSISCDGSQTVIKKIPVNVDYGIMIHDQCVLFNDYNDCSHQSIKMLEFQLKTARGDLIPLHGVNVNFSILFTRASQDV